MTTFKSLAEAFSIMAKYSNKDHAIYADHDILSSCIDPSKISAEDITRLEELGWYIDEEAEDCLILFV